MTTVRQKRSLNTMDLLKLCTLKLPKESRNTIEEIIKVDRKILIYSKELSMATENTVDILQKIEDLRAENNKNWMDLMRLAIREAPEEAKVILSRVHEFDDQITEMFNDLVDSLER